ncbi:MAG TPA: response regulator transcription factor [Firmicutes bacterium]|nr:response regulator transcription factor [Bacillota bacterium]
MTRILIMDDQGLMLEGLRTILDMEEDLEVVATAKTGQELLAKIPLTMPDLVLMDVKQQPDDSLNTMREIKKTYPHIKVLALSGFSDESCVLGALRSGADGYLLKDSPSEDLIRAIRVAMQGGMTLAPQVAGRVVGHMVRLLENEERQPKARDPIRHHLTDRELEVLRLVAQGLSNKEISKILYVTEGTVKNHVSSICQKLRARDRTQVAVFAWKHSLLTDGQTPSDSAD